MRPWDDDDRRLHGESQIAELQRLNREASPNENDALTDDELIDMYRRPDAFGFGCEDEGDWPHVDDDHDDPDRYSDDDLLDMHRAAERALASTCLLHLDHRYPAVVVGVWGPEVDRAWEALADATRTHADRAPEDHEGGVLFVVTEDELREVWDECPHARWFFEAEGDAGDLDIEVVT